MTKNTFPASNNNEQEQLLLKAKISLLQQELNDIEQKTNAFEVILRSHLTNELIEEQELTVLYKKVQLAKKEKRFAQKRKGKNFKEIEGLKVIAKNNVSAINEGDQKEIKRLYREAMLFVHPDKFSMHHEKIDLATEVTTKLIEIYQSGNLAELQIFHKHIFSGNAMMHFPEISENNGNLKEDSYLQKEVEKLEKQLVAAKAKLTYKVLIEYENPLTFIDELKEYYNDRIFKLKKRTRKANLYDL
ncbi:MAG: hypothetical protein CVU08_14980 [Bacteroidetes bacterium HGW-Bacteroidetes-3]|jgi:DnaJ-domain-containing protein 1|nr:MAG: hypothetical protein CVU08_14980 [Bacteroidetes bacterium HGW-Bacteroidetes-3]